MRSGIACFLSAAAISICFASSLSAQISSVAPRKDGQAAAQADEPVAFNNRFLRFTSATGIISDSAVLSAGNNDLGPPLRAQCPRDTPGRCMMTVELHVQTLGTTAEATVGLCYRIKGEVSSCPLVGKAVPSVINAVTFKHVAVIGPGNHLVQPVIFASAGAMRAGYTVVINMYKNHPAP